MGVADCVIGRHVFFVNSTTVCPPRLPLPWSTWRVCFQLSPSVPLLLVQLDPVQGEHSLDFLGHERVLPPFVSETESLHGSP